MLLNRSIVAVCLHMALDSMKEIADFSALSIGNCELALQSPLLLQFAFFRHYPDLEIFFRDSQS
jgi:hypothetical protein